MLRFKPVLVLGALLIGLLALAGCGSSSSSSSSSSAPSSSASATASSSASSTASTQPTSGTTGSCGTIPTEAPGDPEGVLAKFPQSVQASYNLLGAPVHASAWANWKPKTKGPYTIYFSPGNVSTPYIQSMLATFDQLKAKSPNISKVIVQDSNNSLQTQIQQIQQAIREKVSLMVILPLSPAADAPVMAAAGKAGIPVIAPLNVAGSPYVVGLNGNVVLEGAALGQGLAQILNNKGNVLNVHGIPGVLSDSGIFQGVSDVFKNCPNIKTVGSVVGEFTPSVAKTVTLEFLSAHPQPVDGAIHVGGMGLGILQAFTQTGRTVPTIADDGATPGVLAYWNAHKDTYKGLALGLPPNQIADATWYLAEGMFAGRGIKISDISEPPIIITNENLSQWVEPGWTVSTPIAYAPGPPGAAYPPSYLNQFFTKAAG